MPCQQLTPHSLVHIAIDMSLLLLAIHFHTSFASYSKMLYFQFSIHFYSFSPASSMTSSVNPPEQNFLSLNIQFTASNVNYVLRNISRSPTVCEAISSILSFFLLSSLSLSHVNSCKPSPFLCFSLFFLPTPSHKKMRYVY
jgi:hypothetical protein